MKTKRKAIYKSILAIAIVIYTFYIAYNTQKGATILSNLTLENIEALAWNTNEVSGSPDDCTYCIVSDCSYITYSSPWDPGTLHRVDDANGLNSIL